MSIEGSFDVVRNEGPDPAPEPVRQERRDDGVALLVIDVGPGAQNVLGQNALTAFGAALDEIESDDRVRAVVVTSAKPSSFVAGADVSMLRSMRMQRASELSVQAQGLMNRVECFAKPVVAAVAGPCLGLGLELAMACHLRLASEDRSTRFAQPEIQLGLIPGAGGTQRLPRLIDPTRALDMLLTGKKIDVPTALDCGLIDESVPRPLLRDVAARRALELANETSPRSRAETDLTRLALLENPLGRHLFLQQAKKRSLARTRGNYPAVESLLDVLRTGMAEGIAAGLAAESSEFGSLVESPQARQLMWLFLEQRVAQRESHQHHADNARPVQRVGVLGAGLMGAGIGYVTALHTSARVRLRDRDDEAVLSGLRGIRKLVDRQVSRGRLQRHEGDALMRGITASSRGPGLERCDLVVEAVPEKLELKHQVLRQLEDSGGRSCIIASNTSSIPITKIAAALEQPDRVIGMHYFSPVERMPLVELIIGDGTAPWVVSTCAELARQQGKTVIEVKDSPGFFTTRVIAVIAFEAAQLLREGAPVEQVDEALRDFGFPVGPFKLMDEIGLDVIAKIGDVLTPAFPTTMETPFGIDTLVEEGRLGRKSGRGFYTYSSGRAEKDPGLRARLGVEAAPQRKDTSEIVQRCVLRLVNECLRCLNENVVRGPRDVDLGAVLGLGFPPFLGGPMRLCDSLGPRVVLDTLGALTRNYGVRFEPPPLLAEMIENHKAFYPDSEPVPDRVARTLRREPQWEAPARRMPVSEEGQRFVSS